MPGIVHACEGISCYYVNVNDDIHLLVVQYSFVKCDSKIDVKSCKIVDVLFFVLYLQTMPQLEYPDLIQQF